MTAVAFIIASDIYIMSPTSFTNACGPGVKWGLSVSESKLMLGPAGGQGRAYFSEEDGFSSPVLKDQCPVMPGGLNGSSQHQRCFAVYPPEFEIPTFFVGAD